MLKHRLTDRICCIVLAFTILLTGLVMYASASGLIESTHALGYEIRLFDQSRVHTIDIRMDDWEGFLETCTNEAYVSATVVIDGEAVKNVGIRAKGNTSLSSVAVYGNNRYSFKIEFDQYQAGKNYYGLDKLSLNNIIQDTTYMKDYLSYTLMNKMGVPSPLCSYAYLTVNGEDWGLYLAVEAVEDSFLMRNYGKNEGELYKPDSMSFGGGRGNGKNFDINDIDIDNLPFNDQQAPANGVSQAPGGFPGFNPGQGTGDGSERSFDPSRFGGGPGGGGFGGMGSDDVKLKYVDDDPDSYPNIFNKAKTDISEKDKARLIESLKRLSSGEDIESVVDVEAVIRYLVVHDFVVNGDSYTGAMIHNYYLYEKDGQLSMIPWDYNLAFGGFSMGSGSDATSAVNSPIDTPVTMGNESDRPMVAWIFQNKAYTELYHKIYSEFISTVFTSGWFEETFDQTVEMISPYVKKDPTAFYTYEEFTKGSNTIREFCLLRAKSILGQLEGVIPSTREGQSADSSSRIDASSLTISDMGSMGGGRGMGGPGMGGFPQNGQMPDMSQFFQNGQMPDMSNFPQGGQMPDMSNLPQGFQMPDMSNFPQGFQMPDMSNFPQGMPTPPDMGGFPPNGQAGNGNTPAQEGQPSGSAAQMTQTPPSDQAGKQADAQAPQAAQAPQSTETSQPESSPQPNGEASMPGRNSQRSNGTQSSKNPFAMQPQQAGGSQQWILLAVSALVLAGGLVFVILYRRNR